MTLNALFKQLESLLHWLTLVYVLRVPILCALVLLLACFGATSSLVGNLFDVNNGWSMFSLSFTAFVTAWSIMIPWRLILIYGAERFGLGVQKPEINIKWRHILYASIIVLPLILLSLRYPEAFWSTDTPAALFSWKSAVAIAGFLAALVVLVAAEVTQKCFTKPESARRPSDVLSTTKQLAGSAPDVFFPTDGWLRPVFDYFRSREPPFSFPGLFLRLARRVPKNLGVGYFQYENGKAESLLPGHLIPATVFWLVTFLIYFAVGSLKFWYWLSTVATYPTMGYVLQLVMVLGWSLSGLTFFLDRFRVPLLFPAIFWAVATSNLPWAPDHYYPVIDAVMRQHPTAKDSPLPTSPLCARESVIVVAANGGGIQATAWTARVLTGLQSIADFTESLCVISAVSGGSVGAVYYVNEYNGTNEDNRKPPPEDQLDKIVQRAKHSSLDAVGWGLLYPDLAQIISPLPIRFGWDRGRALEEAWMRKDDATWLTKDKLSQPLSAWQRLYEKGVQPGLILNATITETGERLPLATMELPQRSEGRTTQDKFLQTITPKDLAVITATRLSATFPWVSPAPRANVGDKGLHVVDGGYYDTYGMSSLVEWLNYELSKAQSPIRRVLVVEIRAFPTHIDRDPEFRRANEKLWERMNRGSHHGWFYQAVLPGTTLYQVRGAGQLSHNEIELCLLVDRWQRRLEPASSAEPETRVAIGSVVFEFKSDSAPLSWHLNAREQREIEENWQQATRGPDIEAVKQFLGNPESAPPRPKYCPSDEIVPAGR